MKIFPTERKTDCFAYIAEEESCSALTTINCATCAFYKTAEQLHAECAQLSGRIAALKHPRRKSKEEL